MKKRDITEIVFIGMGLHFALRFVQSFLHIFYYLTSADVAYVDRTQGVLFSLFYTGTLLLLSYLLLIKRSALLNRVLPPSSDTAIVIPDGLNALTSYAFWIRIVGMVLFLVSAVEAISMLSVEIAVRRDVVLQSFRMLQTTQAAIAAVLSLFILWKAEWIETILLRKSEVCSNEGNR